MPLSTAMTTRKGMKKALAKAWNEALPHAERAKAARHLARLAGAVAQALDEEVRAVMKSRLPRERSEA